MNLLLPKSKEWQEVERTHPVFLSHLKRYPYLGILPPEGGHYYIFYDQGVQGIVMVHHADNQSDWEVGCSFEPTYRGSSAKKACQNWLNRYKLNYMPLGIRCLAENKPAQYLAAQLGFERQSIQNGWIVYQFPT